MYRILFVNIEGCQGHNFPSPARAYGLQQRAFGEFLVTLRGIEVI